MSKNMLDQKNYKFNILNRRYIGSKAKLIDWIFDELKKYNFNRFADIFAGTGVVADYVIKNTSVNEVIINDFLFSNNVIYEAFFSQEEFSSSKVLNLISKYNAINIKYDNYFSINFGNKFFSNNDAKRIGFIREDLEHQLLNNKEKNIMLASLIYSMDKVANTVGHYEAYRKKEIPKDNLYLELIKPIITNKKIKIFKEDSNELVKKINTDVVFVDPPYNSRQYSRFYHVYENLVKWEKPELYGAALKPKEENMSEYCRSSAPKTLKNLINSIDAKFIALTYNNTYNSKSSSSKNKITFEEIREILLSKGKLTIKEKPHTFFNTGKSDLKNHKEYLFLLEL